MLFDGDERTVFEEHSVKMDKGAHTGSLILTNKRIVLEIVKVKRSKIPIVGKDKRWDSVVFGTDLTNVTRVEVVKKLIGKPVSFKLVHAGKTTQFDVNNPELWYNQILRAKSEMGNNGYRAVNVNLTAPQIQAAPAAAQPTTTHTIERQVVKVRCRYCGNLYDEIQAKCPSCGAR